VTLALAVELVVLLALAVGWTLAGGDPLGRAGYGLVGAAALVPVVLVGVVVAVAARTGPIPEHNRPRRSA
jgi:fatty acid desaturase